MRSKGGTEQPGRDAGFSRPLSGSEQLVMKRAPGLSEEGSGRQLAFARIGGSLFHHGEADRLMRAMTGSFKYDLVTLWDFFFIENIHISSLPKGCSYKLRSVFEASLRINDLV